MRRLSLIASLLVVCLAAASCTEPERTTGPDEVVTVRITPATRQIAVSETTTFTAEALDADGIVLTGETFTFSSLNTAVATIADPTANPVTVTAVANGVATIRATTGGKSGEAILTVAGLPDIQVTGRVVDGATGLGLDLVTVDSRFTNFGPIASTRTGADGSFSFAVPDDGLTPFHYLDVTASKTGYVTTTLAFAEARAPSSQIETILLVQQTSVEGSISGTVRNARTNAPIPGSSLGLTRGQGFSTIQVQGAVSDANGVYTFTQLDAGTYTVRAGATGFRTGSRTAITVASGAVVAQDVLLSPEGDNVVVVLTWGASPSDLDSHLTGPNTDASRFHVYWDNRGSLTAAPRASLDVDDISSFGPETITISQLNSGVYRYSVHDFTNLDSSSSTALGASGAKVELYYPLSGRQTFFVPNQAGTLWTVFELSGSISNPTITVRNSMGLATEPGGILSPPAENSTGPASEPGRVLVFRDRLASYGRDGSTDASLIGRTIRTFPKALQR